MRCKLCNTETQEAFKAKIMFRYLVRYYYCPQCDFLCTEEPFWLEEAYTESINSSDTGILERNNQLAKTTSVLLY